MGTKCKFKNGLQIFSGEPQMVSVAGNVTSNQQVVSTATETVVLTQTIYANTLDTTSMCFRVFIGGEVSAAAATPDCKLTLRYGTTDILEIELTNLAQENDRTFKAEWSGHVFTAGATGKIIAVAFAQAFQGTPLYFATDTANTGTTVDLTADGALNVTAQWSASSADNDIIITHGWIELYN